MQEIQTLQINVNGRTYCFSSFKQGLILFPADLFGNQTRAKITMLVVHLLPSLSCIIEANTIQNVLSKMLSLVSIPIELANCAVHHDRSEPSTLRSGRPKTHQHIKEWSRHAWIVCSYFSQNLSQEICPQTTSYTTTCTGGRGRVTGGGVPFLRADLPRRGVD